MEIRGRLRSLEFLTRFNLTTYTKL
jgi:hypothetical protein